MNQFDDVVLDVRSFSYREVIGQKSEHQPRQNPRSVTASSTVNPLDDLIRVDCTAGAVTMTLETAVGCDGREHTFKKIDVSVNAMTMTAAGSELIDGAATLAKTAQYDWATLKSNGTGWDIIISNAAAVTGIDIIQIQVFS